MTIDTMPALRRYDRGGEASASQTDMMPPLEMPARDDEPTR